MKLLSRQAYERAVVFIQSNARPIEQALYAFHFEGAPAEPALTELASYQNSDGGFGKALEPDYRNPASSALATTHGLNYLKQLGCTADHPMVQRAVGYLLESFDREKQLWRIIPPPAFDFPHAPWWIDVDGSLERTFDNFVVNPRPRLVSLLLHYAGLVPDDWLAELTEVTIDAIEQFDFSGGGGGDDLVQALALAENPALTAADKGRLVKKLQPTVVASVSRDPAAWKTYVIEPLKLAPAPDSLAAPWLSDILPVNLDFRIEQQNEDGSWTPVWSWGEGRYPAAWKQACQEWAGELTLNHLLQLRAYRRIEP